MKSHSYTEDFSAYYFEYIYNCEDCDFQSRTSVTMEVHCGKCGSENVECGLCKSNFETVDELNCEVYKCQECPFRTKFLKDIKIHIENEHGPQKFLCHLKMSRNESDVTKCKLII
jgi:hypothetical protein